MKKVLDIISDTEANIPYSISEIDTAYGITIEILNKHMKSEHEDEILRQENEVLKERIYKLIKEKDFIYSRLNQATALLEEIRRG